MPLVPGRVCGGCTVCCSELHIEAAELKKLAGVRCPNLDGGGLCAIYATRPGTCRDFECGWKLTATLSDAWRPDRSGIVLIPKTKGNPPGFQEGTGVQIVLLRREALGFPELPGAVAAWVRTRVPLFLTLKAPVGLLAASAFLNTLVEGAVRRQDRAALIQVLEEMVEGLSRRKLEPATFGSAPR
ncbi:MAG: YkgJ family cysteine cluster protein [Alphaproteobacteria bacterium]|nr:YkgJ family cysteine cluster protein [Alphaproteobacteria bacterium]MBV9693767.1 YkgJ family cysteine cluster protein [Alphaproteobacteria bacterium]